MFVIMIEILWTAISRTTVVTMKNSSDIKQRLTSLFADDKYNFDHSEC